MKRAIKFVSLVLTLAMLISAFSISPAFAEAKVFADGTYKAGKDIVPGEYIITPSTNYDASYTIFGADGQYIESDLSKSRSVVQLSNNQSIRLNHADMMSALDSPQLDLSGKTLPQGTYRVGIDIPANTYILRPDNDTWVYGTYEIYEVYSDYLGYHTKLIHQEQFNEEISVKVDNWQYFKVRNVNIVFPTPAVVVPNKYGD